MATATLIPSTYAVSSNKLVVTDGANMLSDVSSTAYGSVQNTDESTSYYYIYLRGFDFSTIPARATVNSFTVKVKGRRDSGGYVASLYLVHGTSTIANATATSFTTSNATRTFANGDLTWADLVSYGSNFGIRVNCRRNKKTQVANWYVYGAEIDVDYDEPPSSELYVKQDGEWVPVSAAYSKSNGAWSAVDIDEAFEDGVNYVMA